MIKAYYKFIVLPEEVKQLNKIKSKARLDCVCFSGNYEGLTFFVNKQGQLFLYKVPAKEMVNTHSKRISEWTLSNNNLNFSSIYIENLDCINFGYGYPNKNPFIGIEKKPNPVYPYCNDGYLFIINSDYTVIEVLVIIEGRNLINSYYQHLIDGYFDAEISELRANAKPYFKYNGL